MTGRIVKMTTLATLLPLTVITLILLGAPAKVTGVSAATQTIGSTVYDDTYRNGWADQSWSATVNPGATAHVHSGTYSMRVSYTDAFGGLQITHPDFDTAGYDALTFWVVSTKAYTDSLGIVLFDQFGDPLIQGALTLNDYVPGNQINATWKQVTVPLADLNALNAQIGAIVIQASDTYTTQPLFFDDIVFVGQGTATPTFTVTGTPPTATSTPTPTMSPTMVATPTQVAGLPPVPTGVPSHFGFGLFNADITNMHPGIPYDYRYQYLAGGVNTGDGWQTWQSDGRYVASYVAETRAGGYIPGFVYYNILQSAPAYDDIQNLRNNSTAAAYYRDFKAMLIQMNDGGPAFVIVEPDLDGDWMQASDNTNDDASLQSASVASSGVPELAGIPNNFRGYWQALVHLRDLYAPHVLLAQDLSIWGPGDDLTIALRNDPSYDWQAHADRLATYHNSFGPGYQLLSFSPLDRDAAYYQRFYGSNRWWDENNVVEPTFNTFAAWLNRIVLATGKRVLMWQVPNGNTLYRTENNTDGHYQDNRPEYFLNSSSGNAHIGEWANAGVVGIMFGAGAGGQSHYFDANGDGVTNPSPINGNTLVSTVADDDGGFIRDRAGIYYQSPMPLPGSQPVHCYGATDAADLHRAFGTQRGDPNYDATVDYNNDGFVNVIDANILKQRYGTCQ